MSSNQRNCYCFFDFPHCQRGLVKPKLTKNKMGFNETNVPLTDKQICNFKWHEEKQKLYQVKNKINSLL
jgi:hypothetical protein